MRYSSDNYESWKGYIDYLRIFAALAVVILHVSAVNWYSTDINEYEWQVFNIYDSSVRWAVPVFVMISGALLLEKESTIERIITKCLRLIITFIIWSFFYACFTTGAIGSKIAVFLLGHYHMWYLFMLCGLYLSIPFYRAIVRSGYTYYYLVLAIIFMIIVPEILSSLEIFFGGGKVKTISDILSSDLDYVNVQMVLGYGVYFVLGYILDLRIIKRGERIISYVGACIGIAVTIIGTYELSKHNGVADTHYYYYFSPNVFLTAIGVFVAFKSLSTNDDSHLKQIVVKSLSRNCFGIYLLHPFVIEMSSSCWGISTLSFNPLVSVPIISIIVFGLSYIASLFLSHLPVLGKWIV